MALETDEEKERRLEIRIGKENATRRITIIWGILQLNKKLIQSQRTPWIKAIFSQFPGDKLGHGKVPRSEWKWFAERRLGIIAKEQSSNEKHEIIQHPELEEDPFPKEKKLTPKEKLLKEAAVHERELVWGLPQNDR